MFLFSRKIHPKYKYVSISFAWILDFIFQMNMYRVFHCVVYPYSMNLGYITWAHQWRKKNPFSIPFRPSLWLNRYHFNTTNQFFLCTQSILSVVIETCSNNKRWIKRKYFQKMTHWTDTSLVDAIDKLNFQKICNRIHFVATYEK